MSQSIGTRIAFARNGRIISKLFTALFKESSSWFIKSGRSSNSGKSGKKCNRNKECSLF